MSRGKRYEEPKLNLKKVFAVIIAIIVIIMFICVITGVFTKEQDLSKIVRNSYFPVFKDNKWGVINSKGETIIDPSYEEMITIPNNKKDVFLCIYDVNYETNEYKTKALNSKNEEILTGYEQIEAIQNTDQNNNLWYEENILKVKKDNKYGIINLDGKEITPCEYEEITPILGIKDALKVKKDGKYGVINNEGTTLVETAYAGVTNLGNDNKAGFIVRNDENKYGVVNFSNQVVLEPKYEGIQKINVNDLYVVTNQGKQIIVNKDGEEVLNSDYDEIKEILKNPENGVIFVKDSKFGLINTNKEIKIEATYEDLKEAKSGTLIAKQNGKYGIIDLSNNIKVDFKYTSIVYNEKADIYIAEKEDFTNDILDNNYTVKLTGILTTLSNEKGYIELKQDDEYKYYNFKFEEKKDNEIYTNNTLYLSKKDGKYGFVDKEGNVVVDYIYDDATKQNEFGYAAIKKDGKWGSIDEKGTVVQEPTYNLDEYLKIDFIAKWHLGKDINMNYYNQL